MNDSRKPGTKRTSSVREAAAVLGVSASNLYGAIRDGDFPHIKIRGRVVIPTAALEKFLNPNDA